MRILLLGGSNDTGDWVAPEKRHPHLTRALDMVMRLYDDGRVIAVADEEVHEILDEAFVEGSVG